MNRREFITTTLGAAAMIGWQAAGLAQAGRQPWCRAVAFDALVVFDLRPIFACAEELFPGRGAELNTLWKTRQFEYMWLRTLSGRYADFPTATRDALLFATKSLGLDVSVENRDRLLSLFFQLKAWPDVLPALQQLKGAGLRLGLLSNFSEAMLSANLKSAGLEGHFDQILSTDRVKAFKPDRRAYQMGLDAFQLERPQIAFVAFAGWDAAGAKSFGYPTFWVNRQKAAEEELGVHPDATGSLTDLVKFVAA